MKYVDKQHQLFHERLVAIGADSRTRPQRWADAATSFSGSWAFIGLFVAFCSGWVAVNVLATDPVDRYPFMFLNWMMTVVSTLQSPLILLSQNRQNEMDRERDQRAADDVAALRREVAELKDFIAQRTSCLPRPPGC